MRRHIQRATIVMGAATLAVVVAESSLRVFDGFALASLALVPTKPPPQPIAAPVIRPDLRHVASVAMAAGVDPAWYESTPTPVWPEPTAEMRQRAAENPRDPIGAFFVWNRQYLRRELCAGNDAGALGILQDFYVFDAPDGSVYPIYRHYPGARPPGSFVPDSFGWRNPEITPQRPAHTIRIAFAGASTTIGMYGADYSYPELIGHWLNLWASTSQPALRFEVINAGRAGIEVASIAAVVRQELVPVDPDLVLFYEGANNFAPGKALDMPKSIAVKPDRTFRERSVLENYSVIVRRVLNASDRVTGGDGSEPWKPAYRTVLPDGVNEQAPDLSMSPLPMDLQVVVNNLEAMRSAMHDSGGELAISSFVWHVYPGLTLDLDRHLPQYLYLNDTYWPASYAHLRRMADFQNRVLETFADQHRLAFFDIAGPFPREPDLFDDAIHMNPNGLRLQAWIVLQRLIPLIEQRIADGRWPRPPAAPRPIIIDRHPPLVTRNALITACGR